MYGRIRVPRKQYYGSAQHFRPYLNKCVFFCLCRRRRRQKITHSFVDMAFIVATMKNDPVAQAPRST